MSSEEEDLTLESALVAIAKRDAIIERLERDLDLLKSRLDSQLRQKYGPKSERFDNGQLPLFGDIVEAPPSKEAPPPRNTRKSQARSAPRQALSEGLERVAERQKPEQAGGLCDCCNPPQPLNCIGVDATEVLEYTAAKLHVRVIEREKWACPSKQGTVFMPPAEKRILPKSYAGTSLLLYLIVAKFIDHLPLHRIRKQFKRDNVRIPESTLCDWIGAVADAVSPVVLALKRELLARDYLQVDETPAKARDPGVRGKLKTIYFFAYSSPWGEVVFDYRTNRRGENAQQFLEDFEGRFIQVDEYAGYDRLFEQRPTLGRVGCWSHARRYFKKAYDRGDRPGECAEILQRLALLFSLETSMRDRSYSAEARLRVRRRVHLPMIGRLIDQSEVAVNDPRVEPQSDYGKAVRYLYKHRQNLTVCLGHGEVEFDNNGVENAIRPLALGRKNWLHIGHIEAGDRAAVLYSLLASCERLGINPQEYLQDVLERLPLGPPVSELTPRAWLESKEIQREAPENSSRR